MKLFSTLFAALFFLLSVVDASPVVLITGASRGIGQSIAELLVLEGYRVYGGVRTLPSIQSNVHYVKLDVTDDKSVDEAIQVIMEAEDRLDVVVNNAGILKYGSLENHTVKEAQEIFDVNFFGVMRVCNAVLPIMRAQKQGRIIQISSRSAFRPLPSMSLYAASKFALVGVSETLAAVVKPWNISVSLIEPGPVNTELDFQAPYGTGLGEEDPYYPIFFEAGLMDPVDPEVQEPREIALLVKEAIEAQEPQFRYQTTEKIKGQAAHRLVDPTGLNNLREWHTLLFP